jgi:phenylpropionate dioxygenase-like ring-hydroxylating dioxygenase large terminal subunit
MLRKVYGQLDKSALSLRQARVEVHGGLVFATWASDGVSLEQFLAGAAWYLDALLLAPPEGWETGGPPQRYIAPGNWKLGADNYSGDSYHVDYTHKTALDAGFFEDTGAAEWHSLHVATKQGHGLRVALLDGPESFWFPGFPGDVQRRLSESLGDDHRELMDRVETIHGTLFPNLSFIYLTFAHTGDADEQITAVMHVRQWQPVDADTHEVLSFMLVPRHAPADFKRRSVLIGYRTLGGAAAYFEGDDIHNFTSIRQGLRGAVGRSAASDFSMGTRLAGHSDTGQDGSSVTRQVHGEANQRAFYTAWHALMAEED